MRPKNNLIFAAINAAVSHNSDPIPMEFMLRYSGQAVFSSNTLNGSIQVQVSNDPPNGAAPSHWSNLGSSISVASGALTLIPFTESCYQWARIVWTASSGAGTISLRLFAIGAN